MQRALGPEPQWVPPAPPWPACATALVRRPLEAEHRRRQDEARAAFKRESDAWRKAGQPIRDTLAAGVHITAPEPSAPFKDRNPVAADAFRSALGPSGPVACIVRDLRPAAAGSTAEEKAASKASGEPLTGPSAYHILCESPPGGSDAPTFLVTVPARLVAARLDGSSINSWRFEPEGHFAPDLRGRIATIGVGQQLELTGIGRLFRGVRDPGFGWPAWRGTEWAVDFNRTCPHEGAGCTFNDGQPTAVVRAAPLATCSDAIASRANDVYEGWRRMSPTSPDAQMLAGWIDTLAPTSAAGKRMNATRKRLAGDLDGAAALFREVSDAAGLAEVAELQFKSAPLIAAGLANLDAAIGLEPRAVWRIRAAGMAIQSGDKARGISHLRALVNAASTADDIKHLKQAAALLKFGGDADGARAAEARLVELKKR